MKIVITVNTYYPLTDGVQAVTQYEAEGLAKLGNDVTVVTVKYPHLVEKEEHNGVKIIRYNIYTKHALYRGDIKGYRSLILSLCKNADVLINVCTQTATTEVLFPIMNKIKCKKVLYMHGFHNFEWHKFDIQSFSSLVHKIWNNLRWRYDYIFNAKYMKSYDLVVQLHPFVNSAKYFKKKYHVNTRVIGNAVDPDFFDVSKNFSNIAKPYAICVANYLKGKNQEYILRAFYKSNLKKLSLVLIGSKRNSYLDYLENLKSSLDKKYGYRKVLFLVEVPRNEISTYVRSASIYLLGSKKEVFPISIVESMAAGVPFISTDVGIVRYLPGGKVVSTEEEMTFWIKELVCDHQVANLLGKIGNIYARKHFSESENTMKLYKALEQIVKEKN